MTISHNHYLITVQLPLISLADVTVIIDVFGSILGEWSRGLFFVNHKVMSAITAASSVQTHDTLTHIFISEALCHLITTQTLPSTKPMS
ncbi:MAG: hypothetical protein ACTH6Z_05310 [Psychrobacter sp.]|uniref:hypothetical protein n=1 Tax=Psychrobacter sp. AOP7-B1-25 TaxID=3457644 RepID=UPI003FB9BFF5